jgi:CHAD domain-containing protein
MPMDRERARETFRKLNRQLQKLSRKPTAENVHGFRTCSRRVETMLEELGTNPGRNHKKLLKLLGRLRKRAGRVRDLDAQIVALRSLKIPQEPGRRAQLMRVLIEERARREKKLVGTFDSKTAAEVGRRLTRAANKMKDREETDVLALARRRVSQLGADRGPITEKTLHQYRIVGKRARYLAELAGKDSAAEQFIAQLKRMQDVLGDWHDWLQLSARAEELFGGVSVSALVAALQNVTRAKFRQAVHALMETRAALGSKKPSILEPRAGSGQKPSAQAITSTPAVA